MHACQDAAKKEPGRHVLKADSLASHCIVQLGASVTDPGLGLCIRKKVEAHACEVAVIADLRGGALALTMSFLCAVICCSLAAKAAAFASFSCFTKSCFCTENTQVLEAKGGEGIESGSFRFEKARRNAILGSPLASLTT